MKVILFVLTSILLTPLFLGVSAVTSSETAGFSFAYIDTTFDGIEATDENNQPVVNSDANTALRSLFVLSTYEMLVNSEIHTIAESLVSLRKQLKLDANSLALPLINFASAVFVIASGIFRFNWDRVLSVLTGFASMLVLIYFSILCFKISVLPLRKTTPLPLIC